MGFYECISPCFKYLNWICMRTFRITFFYFIINHLSSLEKTLIISVFHLILKDSIFFFLLLTAKVILFFLSLFESFTWWWFNYMLFVLLIVDFLKVLWTILNSIIWYCLQTIYNVKFFDVIFFTENGFFFVSLVCTYLFAFLLRSLWVRMRSAMIITWWLHYILHFAALLLNFFSRHWICNNEFVYRTITYLKKLLLC